MVDNVALTGKQGLHVKNEPRAMVDLHILVFIKAGPEGTVHPFSIIANNLGDRLSEPEIPSNTGVLR